MRLLALTLLPLLMLIVVLPAEEGWQHLEGTGFAPAQATKAYGLIAGRDNAKRGVAFRAFRKRGLKAVPIYREVLTKARPVFQKKLADAAKRSGEDLVEFVADVAAWKEACDPTLKAIRVDYKKDRKKIGRVEEAFMATARVRGKVVRHLKSGENPLYKLGASAETLQDIDVELAWCEAVTDASADDSLSVEPQELEVEEPGEWVDSESRPDVTEYLKELPEGKQLLEHWKMFQKERTDYEDYLAATEHNKKSRWAAGNEKAFAEIINERRYVMGLEVLRLEEKLSDACDGHSREMIELKFFAHNSPTEKNKSPGKRAKNAGYKGSWRGENIFMGSSSGQGAFSAWWYSDGHRFIMFAAGSNTLGIGNVSSHWTMNTGRDRWGK